MTPPSLAAMARKSAEQVDGARRASAAPARSSASVAESPGAPEPEDAGPSVAVFGKRVESYDAAAAEQPRVHGGVLLLLRLDRCSTADLERLWAESAQSLPEFKLKIEGPKRVPKAPADPFASLPPLPKAPPR